VHDLLGRAADQIKPLVVRSDRATYRVTVGGRAFVVKTDDDHATVTRETTGHQRAADAGVRVPELVSVTDDAIAMAWIEGIELNHRSTPDAWRDAGAQLRIAHNVGCGLPFGAGFGGYEPAHVSWREFFETFAARELEACERELGFPSDAANRIRAAITAPGLLDAPHLGWCHGDLQPQHVLIDPVTERVAAIIDWADHGPGDVGWDIAVLTIDHDSFRAALLDGYGAGSGLRAALDGVVPLFSVIRLVSEANWLDAHHYAVDDNIRRAVAWRW
jgi:aminoglycoside phosphotransferase (APT) family kinase protein